jgi:hypothetical protein
LYEPGVVVRIGGNVYFSLISHTSSINFIDDILKWELLASGSNFRNEWTVDTRYRIGDVIRYNGNTYQCILEHVSGQDSDGIRVGNNDSVDDSTAETWITLAENYTFSGTYQQETVYRKNDLVKYGSSIFRCIQEHTSPGGLGEIINENFVLYLSGYQFTDQWNSLVYYAIGDVIKQGGTLYVAATNNINSPPGVTSTFQAGNPAWTVITKGINFLGDFNPTKTDYKQGDITRIGGALWVRTVDQIFDGSTLAFLDDTGEWELVVSGQNFRGTWTLSRFYNVGDVTYFRGTAYHNKTPHLSSTANFPENVTFNFWEVLIDGDEDAALVRLGDILTYNLKRTNIGDNFAQLGNPGELGTANIPAGTTDQVLVVNDNSGNVGYKTWGTLERVFFVSLNGIDDAEDSSRGSNYFKPYRTVRFALEQADDDFEGTTTIKISTGEFEEILPLIVPKRTAVIGEELRSTTIRASLPIPALANDAEYTINTLIHLGTLLSGIIEGEEVSVSSTNQEVQDISVAASSLESFIVNEIWSTIINIINFKVESIGSMPSVTGSNTLTTDQGRLDAVTVLENNRHFIKEEAIAWMAENNPLYSFNTDKCRRDIDKFIDAVQYDLRFPGNYKSMMAGRYYANAVIGSQLEDMFYVRDTTGIRNLTLKGLDGSLPPLEEGLVYRIPTGGSFVSLDPGWGPDDESVWITNRSCYVQNVTTFGNGAVGQKIDGSLHNGGNRSIVSNDFTQVISDGIGAWVSNGGRAELVSVFTYYAHIGMFAKDGGIIRATNGNSSYGEFGAVADGIDASEEVRFANVNTTTTQATVDAAFAGEVLDFILALEFRNAGQNYTTANYNIRSSGIGATAIQEEIRDDAMFECRILNPGFGFRQFGNQAQAGDDLTITLAAAENVEESEILGMRLLIISGEGTGQYGYIQGYNVGTKVCTIYRESDDQPGWDNILPGNLARSVLTTGTRYRIEPRVTFNEPPFTAEEITIDNLSAWSAAAYGETDEIFTGITAADIGTGTTIDVVPVSAEFTVNKLGRNYSVSLLSAGAGYKINDIIILNGTDLGGITGENDIRIRVLSISDDSTNSVLTWQVENTPIAASGNFVLTPLSSDVSLYSKDGVNWESSLLPSSRDWKCLTAGNNRFITIANNSDSAAWSSDGTGWTAVTMPSSRLWNSVIYGKPSNTLTGVFVAVSGNGNVGAFSLNGTSWTEFNIPVFSGFTDHVWVDISFGFNRFVAVSKDDNIIAIGTWNDLNISWQLVEMDNVGTPTDWISIAYGNRRFVAMASTGEVSYSFEGNDWYDATMPTADGSTIHNWKKIRYGQGVFLAVGDTGGAVVGSDPTLGPTTFVTTSYDGIVWSNRETASEESWNAIAFGNPDITLGDSTFSNSTPVWVIAPGDLSFTSDKINRIFTGAKALGRATVSGSGVGSIRIWEPGSGYIGDPILTLTDPNKTAEVNFRTRIADGVLAQPTFINKGSSYKTSTTFVTVSGDGYADITPVGDFITIDNLEVIPGPGAQFYIGGKNTFFTAAVVGIDQFTLPNGKFRSTFRVIPKIGLTDDIENNMEVLIRERYSQVRITGHDFLDVGTGNFEETNYPELYRNYEFTTKSFQETQNLNGGRVFFTSTDQDGNFRAGQQFAVEQASGILTISADFFDLSGLTELRLAGINVGSTAVIREFSRDPLLLQNSNNVIPTQRAIVAYLQSRLNIGGEDLLTPAFVAGTVRVGPNLMNSTAEITIDLPVIADFEGKEAGINGSILAQTMFFRSFRIR